MAIDGSQIGLFIVLISFLILLSAWLPNMKGAPWIPTRLKKVKKMLLMADVKPGETIYDLGCGDGRVIIMAARKFKAKAIGVEIDPLRFLWCQFLITVLGLRKRVKVLYGDLFHKDLQKADVVFCYLLQSTNNRLEEKLIEELSPDTRIVSNTFQFFSLPLINVDESGIFVYKIGEENKTE